MDPEAVARGGDGCRESGDRSPPAGSRGKGTVGGVEVKPPPQKKKGGGLRGIA